MKLQPLRIAAFALLASCVARPAPQPTPTPEFVGAPAPSFAIVDLCVHESGDPVCVLHEDGRVSCAHIDDDQFAPPLAGITDAVELSCGKHSICARDAEGSITCLSTSGELHRIDGLAGARSLARDCAVGSDGELHCWNEEFELRLRHLPAIVNANSDRYAQQVDLQLAAVPKPEYGCVIERSGELWCWGLGVNVSVDIGELDGVSDLSFEYRKACFRRDGQLLCVDREAGIQPKPECDGEPCTCSFSWGSCSVPTEGKPLDPTRTVHDVVRREGPCVLDAQGSVVCQAWEHVAVHEITLAPTSETTARFDPVERVPPPPEPEPLPDPAQTECPAATKLSNRVCEKLTEPGGPLACEVGETSCPRRCRLESVYDDRCEPSGFNTVRAGRSYDRSAEYLVYIDGPRVWLGPPLPNYMEVSTIADAIDASAGPVPVEIELYDQRDDGSTYFVVEHELSAVLLCSLVDRRPACSGPIAREWTYEYTEWDEDSGRRVDHQTAEYRAELSVSGDDLQVTIRRGKQHVDTKDIYSMEDTRVLRSGKHSLASLLDRRFVYLPE